MFILGVLMEIACPCGGDVIRYAGIGKGDDRVDDFEVVCGGCHDHYHLEEVCFSDLSGLDVKGLKQSHVFLVPDSLDGVALGGDALRGYAYGFMDDSYFMSYMVFMYTSREMLDIICEFGKCEGNEVSFPSVLREVRRIYNKCYGREKCMVRREQFLDAIHNAIEYYFEFDQKRDSSFKTKGFRMDIYRSSYDLSNMVRRCGDEHGLLLA